MQQTSHKNNNGYGTFMVMGMQVKVLDSLMNLAKSFRRCTEGRNPIQINNALIYPIKKNK